MTVSLLGRAPHRYANFYFSLEVGSIALIFVALFGKDILGQFLWGFEKRNLYGGCFLVIGGLLGFIVLITRGEFARVLQTLRVPLIFCWTAVLLIAVATSLYFRGALYFSPHAAGFVSAVVCYLVSPAILRRTLIVLLIIQFGLLLYEFCFGISLTPSVNEALGYNLPMDGWIIDPSSNLVRAKGLFDSTHDSTWTFLYATFVHRSSTILFVAMPFAAWFSLGRLGIMIAAALVATGPKPLKVGACVAILALAMFAAAPEKTTAASKFFLDAFNPSSSSNTYRAEATKGSIDYLLQRPPAIFPSEGSMARLLFGVSGLALISGDVKTESSYTLFLIEYGIVGFLVMGWTLLVILIIGIRKRQRANLIFFIMMAVAMASSAIQSASSFFMFWIAVFHLAPLLPEKSTW